MGSCPRHRDGEREDVWRGVCACVCGEERVRSRKVRRHRMDERRPKSRTF